MYCLVIYISYTQCIVQFGDIYFVDMHFLCVERFIVCDICYKFSMLCMYVAASPCTVFNIQYFLVYNIQILNVDFTFIAQCVCYTS